jgi:putative component of membrane protein insertase Oxa1/YidC/SpoIIIJ protein YidD
VKSLALAAIGLYQRFLSPHKGFCCAYAAHTGHASCSVLGYRAIRRFGLWQGIAVLDQRLNRCGLAARRARRIAPAGPLRQQAGSISCDLPCDACDVLDCASDCDWRRRKRRDDGTVVIPPRRQQPRTPR